MVDKYLLNWKKKNEPQLWFRVWKDLPYYGHRDAKMSNLMEMFASDSSIALVV